MKLLWVRGAEKIRFTRPSVWFVLGVRGSGKSSFLEHLGENYLDEGAVVLDLFGSRDGEGLAWLRSPYADDRRILLLKGENVDVDAPCDVKPVSALQLSDFESYDIIVSASPLYSSMDDEFLQAARITDKLYKRLHWKRLVYCIVREAANFYYSRLKVTESQVIAKSQMVYLIRESRHVGLALGLDSIRYYAIDIDIRNVSDYLVLKSQGMFGLASDLQWLYSIFDPHAIRNLQPQNFIIVARGGAVGLGEFPYPSWHKRERENILRAVGVKVEYGEPLVEGEYKGTYRTVGDLEHAEIIRLYIEEGLSMPKIAEALGRSSRTIQTHIHKHNRAVERSGFCPACRRARSPYEASLAIRQGVYLSTTATTPKHGGEAGKPWGPD